MNIPKKAKALYENENYIVLKIGNHKYSVFDKNEERNIYESNTVTACYNFFNKDKGDN